MFSKSGNGKETIVRDDANICLPVRGEPYEHQKRAFEFAVGIWGISGRDGHPISNGVALLMEMGTGKTFVAIALMGCLFLRGFIKRVLIVAPLTVVDLWRD